MNYKTAKEMCASLRQNINKMSSQQRLSVLFSIISEIPNSNILFGYLGILDDDMIRDLLANNGSGYEMCKVLINSIDEQISDTEYITLNFYGYTKPIATCMIDNYIDITFNYINDIEEQQLTYESDYELEF